MSVEFKIYETEKYGVRLFYADVSGLDIKKNYPHISEYRRSKTSALKHDADKRLSLGAELLLIYALEKYYKHVPVPICLKFEKNGKPVLDGVCFNLAHAGNLAVCAVADRPVGVDAELSDRVSEAVIKRTFCGNETDYDFAYIWTRKEAAVKADGGGIVLGLAGIDVTGDFVGINGKKYRLVSINPEITGYALAFCVQSDADGS